MILTIKIKTISMGCISEQMKESMNQISVPSREQDNTNYLFDIPTGDSCPVFNKNKNSITIRNSSPIFLKVSRQITPIIKYPRLLLEIENTETKTKVDNVIITPNLIGNTETNLVFKPESIFSFGTGEENDFIINFNNISQHQFDILFKDDSFCIEENQSSRGVFLKVNHKKEIKEEIILSFGNCFVSLNVFDENKMYVIYQEENEIISSVIITNEKTEFKIGRGADCDIIINNDSISRVQCTLAYQNDKWVLYDGSIHKGSTNGLWYVNYIISIIYNHN